VKCPHFSPVGIDLNMPVSESSNYHLVGENADGITPTIPAIFKFTTGKRVAMGLLQSTKPEEKGLM
jgi:hypothetical protein